MVTAPAGPYVNAKRNTWILFSFNAFKAKYLRKKVVFGYVSCCGFHDKGVKSQAISEFQKLSLSKRSYERSVHLSKLAGRTIAGPVSLKMKWPFQEFLWKNHLFRAHYSVFDWSGWIVLIKSEILVTTGRCWPLRLDKWKRPIKVFYFSARGKKSHFHISGFTHSLALKQRLGQLENGLLQVLHTLKLYLKHHLFK